MVQSEKMATPEAAVIGFAAQVRMAPPAGGVMLKVIEAVLEVTVLPPASCTATTGWVGKVTPLLESEGLVVKASLSATPVEMVKAVLTALVRLPEVAVSV